MATVRMIANEVQRSLWDGVMQVEARELVSGALAFSLHKEYTRGDM